MVARERVMVVATGIEIGNDIVIVIGNGKEIGIGNGSGRGIGSEKEIEKMKKRKGWQPNLKNSRRKCKTWKKRSSMN